MGKQITHRQLEKDLLAIVAQPFPGIAVAVEHSDRWNRMSVTFRWDGFCDLLPEERFQRLANAIPEDFRASRLPGFVWLELTLSETVDEVLRSPRSEDIVDREEKIYASLLPTGFFDLLRESLSPNPTGACGGGFAKTVAILSGQGMAESGICDAKLLFIRYGAYCDCQVLASVQAELAKHYAGAA